MMAMSDPHAGGTVLQWGAPLSAATVAMIMVHGRGASAEDIARTCHAHPTMSEAIREAAKGVDGWVMQA